MSELEGRGAAWTERGTSEGRRQVKGEGEVGGAPEASGGHRMSELEGRGAAWTERGTSEGRRRLEASRKRAGDTA
jgi:hypothetical protein